MTQPFDDLKNRLALGTPSNSIEHMKHVDVIEDPTAILLKKVAIYAKKFKDFDPRIIAGCALCYKHSPLYRQHIASSSFGKTMGWRLTHAWTQDPKRYSNLKMVGPLDLGLFSVRIDAILGNNQLLDFVEEAKQLPIFTSYIHATQNFILNLLANEDIHWLTYKTSSSNRKFLELCKSYSPTFRAVSEKGNGDGWDLVKIWSENPEKITGLRDIFPLDIAIYCVRLDSIIYDTDLTSFATKINAGEYASFLPMEVMKFVCQIQNEWGIS
ncbi:hypothetical protein RQM59_10095 [Flavobacteriaceae bacterium S356]|uniref:Uncharacterized protein n=1 Tax=Asprobacillus argus TaxID=3076534 RepID=A0ABU3LG65_9FLAO|nr:hypothetical protein [Flavobacteriaceae bacterium S356]